ncbi:MAG: ATP-binding protein [Candidatus Obscuribacterales bacterium]
MQEKVTTKSTGSSSQIPHCLTGGGKVGALMRSIDWSSTGLGDVQSWSQALQLSISLCLNSRFPLILWWGPELLVLYNDPYTEHLQSKHPGALAKVGREVWGEIWPVIGPMLESVFTTGEPTWSDDLLLLLRRNGFPEETYHTFSYSAIKDSEGKIVGVFTPVSETTERVIGARRLGTLKELSSSSRAEKEEELCLNLAKSLNANSIDFPVWGLMRVKPESNRFELIGSDLHGVIPQNGDLSESGFGQQLANCLKDTELVLLEDLPDGLKAMPPGVWGEAPTKAVMVPLSVHKDDEGLVFFSAVSPHRPWDDSCASFFKAIAREISISITEVRTLEVERFRAEKLAELDKAKTLFFGNVSHEFRTPLTLMLGPLQSILESKVELGEARTELSVAYRNGLRLLRLVNTLLDFSRIEAGRVEAVYEPTDLAVLTAELASNFRSAIEKADLELSLDCKKLSEPAYVDRDMWEKIVLNLLSNAFKFCLVGSISVSLTEDKDNILLSVSDTGCGIEPSELPNIFQRFHRTPSSRGRTFEGTGIGLALVEELVRLHGGNIAVTSVVDEGTTFTVSIPRGQGHLPQERISGARNQQSTAIGAAPFVEEASRWLRSAGQSDEVDDVREAPTNIDQFDPASTVLIADDNSDMRDYLVRLLQPYWNVVAVADGMAAWNTIAETKPSLVITDVMMPLLDGFQLLQRIRESDQTKTIPVLMLSARAGEESRIEGLAAGADDYVAKPFSARELLAVVRANLRLSLLRKELSEELEQTVLERTADATRANDELRAMAYLVSEYVQEPANIIASYLKLLSVRYKDRLGDDANEFIDKCSEGSRSVVRMVDDLWHYSRVDDKPDIQSNVDLGEALERVLRELSEHLRIAKASVVKPDDLPIIDCNPAQIEYVFKNLLRNAIGFARPGVEPEIVITCADNGSEWLFCFQDNGIGIDPMDRTEVFKPFTRLNARPNADGTGMGLAIAKRIVLAHHGQIWVEAEQHSSGAELCFTLPKAKLPE